jgi:hypothetical protein
MKVKIIGFKVGVSRPTFNRTIEVINPLSPIGIENDATIIGKAVTFALSKSDFLSIRKVD